MKALENRLKLIESFIPHAEHLNPKVSKVTIAWQLDHSLKVINSITKAMQNSDPSLYVDNFSILGKVLLKLNFFPKGKAKSPDHVKPPTIILKENIILQLQEARDNIKQIKNLDEKSHFKHPLFGNINKARVFSFLNAHTNHHLKIVKSILN
tara:strand:+ start:5846 stop:6301 length:456 start_codon:yes stop_codon:yes gene_type:complete